MGLRARLAVGTCTQTSQHHECRPSTLICNHHHFRPFKHDSEKVAALPGGAAALESKLAALEAAAGCRFAPGGPTPGRRVMAHLREPLKVSYRCGRVCAWVGGWGGA